jgi:hypothetical protein
MRRLQNNVEKRKDGNWMKKTKSSETDRIVIGGLHRNDFMWVSNQCEEADLVFCGFMLDVDGYHWKAIYVKADQLEKTVEER